MLKSLIGWYNLILFVTYYFSLGTLINTFFTPWHRYIWKNKQRGLHLDELFYVLVSNILSRIIGILLRSFIITLGIITTISAVIFGLPISLILSIFDPESFLFSESRFGSIRGIAWDWHYGYTPKTDEFSEELYYHVLDMALVGRENEIEEVDRVLQSDREKNILLVGEPGSGRRALLTHLAHQYSSKRFLYFDWAHYFKGLAGSSDQAAKLEDILFEIKHAGNIVLILPDIHELVHFSNTFEQYINSVDLHIIGITIPQKYHEQILPDKSFMKQFIPVDTNPLSKENIISILVTLVSQSKYNDLLSKDLLESIYHASLRLQTTEQKHQPEAAIELLSEFMDYIKSNQTKNRHTEFISSSNKHFKKILNQVQNNTTETVHDDENNTIQYFLKKFIEQRLEIPFGAISGSEKETLKHLDAKLHERIVNQKEAIGEITSALRRRQLQISSEKKPVGSFMFLGPTGVGKTETAKALADIFFEDPQKLIRFDMAQYQHETQMADLTKELARSIRETPYAVLLLDEIEKANKSILNIFLSIVDEGYFFDENRSKVLCSDLIIIGTSNAASEFIRENVVAARSYRAETKGAWDAAVINYILKHHLFSPEFINRFDAVAVYTPLSDEHLREIAEMKLIKLRDRLQVNHHKTFSVSKHLIDHIVDEGTHPEFGAREIDRTIRRLVEEPLAEKLLE